MKTHSLGVGGGGIFPQLSCPAGVQ
ncbi:uncharacterized protein METZ01_LOCUS473771, partial [marine metagenome]